jgi:methionine synthase II (cobalamin-independent)
MAIKIVDKILPTTMVGSYPRPHWFTHQLRGRDVRVAFKEVAHEEAYTDAVAAVIRDQESAGLDIVTDGNMWYDDYVGVIGRSAGISTSGSRVRADAQPAPSIGRRPERRQDILDDWGGVINSGPVDKTARCLRWTDLYKIAQGPAKCP